MDENALQLKRLRVHRMYGLRQNGLLVDELVPGINIIAGPNASGKTTLARSLEVLLWPESFDEEASVEGRFQLGSHEWLADVDGSHRSYQRDGADTSPPPVPSSDHRDRYHLYLHELLQAMDGSGSFAEIIQRETAGGFDVTQARDALNLSDGANRSGQATRRVEEAREALTQVKEEQESLWSDHQKLDALKRDLSKARDAQQQVTILHQVLDVLSVQQELEDARAQKSSFPDILERVKGTEYDSLKKLQDEQEECSKEIADLDSSIKEEMRKLEESSIPEDGLPDGFVAELEADIRGLEKLEHRATTLQHQLSGKRKESQTRWRRIESVADKEALFALDVDDVERLGRLAEEAEGYRARRKVNERYAKLLQTDEPAHLTDDLKHGLRQLHRWLSAREELGVFETAAGRIIRQLMLVGGILLMILGAIVGFMAHPVGWAVLVIGLIFIGAVFLLGEEGSGDDREQYQREFERVQLDEPQSWEYENVEQRAGQLIAEISECTLTELKQSERARLKSKRDELDRTQKELEEERSNILDDIGLSLDIESDSHEGSLYWLLKHVVEWQDAEHELQELEEEIEKVRKDIERALDSINQKLNAHGFRQVGTCAEAEGVSTYISKELSTFKLAKQNLRGLRQQRDSASRRLENKEADITQVYDKLDLEEEDASVVRELVQKRDSYVKASDLVRECEIKKEGEEQRLAGLDEEYERWLEKSESEINQLLASTEEKAAKADHLSDRISRLEERIRLTQDSHDLEEAQARHRKALDELEEDRHKNIGSNVGWHLAEFVQESTRDESLPAVFHRARDLFLEITRGRYELGFNQRTGEFYATDNQVERGYRLDELSSGTRVQLLLAVRLAFIEEMEGAVKLPLVLDETLANSDDIRASAIIEAIRMISKRGRQVFYFTAQEDEVRKWKAALSDNDQAVSSRFILLDERRSAEDIQPITAPSPILNNELSSPEDVTHQQYFDEMNVPRWSPRSPVGEIHLWYLEEDPQVLYRLVKSGYSYWGPLSNLADRGGAAAVGLDDDSYARIRARAKMFAAWREAYMIGRGKRVDRAALEQTDAVTHRKIEGVARLTEKVGGDAEAILRGLEEGAVSRFLESKRKELRDYFLKHDYLDTQETLPEGEIWDRIMRDVADHVEAGHLDVDDMRRLMDRVAHPVDAHQAGSEPAEPELF